MTEYMKKLAKSLEENCPDNDCRIYLNLYRLYQEYVQDLENSTLGINTQHVIRREINRVDSELCDMYISNCAIRKYRREDMVVYTKRPRGAGYIEFESEVR